MMDRYDGDDIEQDMNERVGTKFLQCSQRIYEALSKLPQKKGGVFADKLQLAGLGLGQLDKLYRSYEANRPKFIIPEILHNNYHDALYNYDFIKHNPEEYFRSNDTKIEDLEKEKQFLVEKIRNKEVKFSRHEDDIRHANNAERTRLITEIGRLTAKKAKYEAQSKSKSGKGILSSYFGGRKDRLAETLAKITETEARLREIGTQSNDMLEAKRYQLTLLHKRRWSIEKAINAFADSPKERTKRWHKATDNADILRHVRRLEIDEVMSRYYAEFPKSLLDYFLNTYSTLQNCVKQLPVVPDKLKLDLEQLSMLADGIFKIDMPYRSMLGLYNKLLKMNVDPEIDFSGSSLRSPTDAPVIAPTMAKAKSTVKIPPRRKKVRGSEADDLPDITPQLLKRLNKLWKTDDVLEEPPVRWMATAIREHMSVINPYIEMATAREGEWFDNWRDLYQIAQTMEFSAEAFNDERTYSVPEELKRREIQANMDLGKVDGEWETAKLDYTVGIDKRQAELTSFKNKMQAITEAKDVSTMLKLQLVPEPIKSDSRPGSMFKSLFGHNKKEVASAPIANDLVENVRARLLKEYEDEYKFKVQSLAEFSEHAPTKPVKYHQSLNAVKAEIIFDKMKFYRRIDLPTMLNAVRMYVLSFKTYYQIYHENPFSLPADSASSGKPDIAPIAEEIDQTMLKAKAAFQQLLKGMRDHLETFYCLQPCRCTFNYYLDNFNNIQNVAVREAILKGRQDDLMLESVFPKFEVPAEVLPTTLVKTL